MLKSAPTLIHRCTPAFYAGRARRACERRAAAASWQVALAAAKFAGMDVREVVRWMCPPSSPQTMRPSRAPSVLVALAAACLLSAATAEEELGELGEGSCVSSLGTGNFEAAIRGKNALVVFFAPWCGHCKALHPHFERLCADLSDQDEFLAAVVDATEEVELAQSHGVTGTCLPRLANWRTR